MTERNWVDQEYVEVLQQLLVIALPNKKFNNYPPCPWLARGLATGKVVIERGIATVRDVKKAEEYNTDRWATCFWYQPSMSARELELVCESCCNDKIEVLYMHPMAAPKPMGVPLSGKYPLLIVQNKKLLETARRNLPPDYPFEF